MLHAVIFDVDGTLIDSVDLHAKRSSDLSVAVIARRRQCHAAVKDDIGPVHASCCT